MFKQQLYCFKEDQDDQAWDRLRADDDDNEEPVNPIVEVIVKKDVVMHYVMDKFDYTLLDTIFKSYCLFEFEHKMYFMIF